MSSEMNGVVIQNDTLPFLAVPYVLATGMNDNRYPALNQFDRVASCQPPERCNTSTNDTD